MYNGRRESDDVLRLALAVGDILEEDGYDVIYTRTGDITQSVGEKARIANQSQADFFVSIHRNAAEEPGVYNGVSTLIYDEGGIKQEMARNVNKALEETGFVNLGIDIRPNLVVLNSTNMPAILIEAGFIDNEKDNRLFDDNFTAIAEAIAEGIESTLEENTEQENIIYKVQTGAFRNRTYADNLEQRLKRQGYPASVEYEDGLYKVRVGAYEQLDEAADVEARLRNRGYVTFITT